MARHVLLCHRTHTMELRPHTEIKGHESNLANFTNTSSPKSEPLGMKSGLPCRRNSFSLSSSTMPTRKAGLSVCTWELRMDPFFKASSVSGQPTIHPPTAHFLTPVVFSLTGVAANKLAIRDRRDLIQRIQLRLRALKCAQKQTVR